jgi:hypothetical protein
MSIEILECKDLTHFLLCLERQRISLVKVRYWHEPRLKDRTISYVCGGIVTATKSGMSQILRMKAEIPIGLLKDRLMLSGYIVSEGEWKPELVEELGKLA